MKNFLYFSCLMFFWIASTAVDAHVVVNDEKQILNLKRSKIILAAGNCAARANALAASYGNATVLSVTDNGNSCTIVIRVKDSNGGHPRIIRKTVSG